MILVIAEKPSVAQTIAAVLGAKEKKDGFLTGSGYIVSWCVGHLVGLAEAAAYGEQYKKWSYDSLPILPQEWKYTVASDKEKQFKTLKELMHRADVSEVVNACDAGREGELIFRFVYEMAGCKKPMRRLWISSMEDSAINEGFSRLKNGEEYDALFASALCRAKADWLIGINATRLFSVLYNHTLNVGRVQTPTLKMLVDRDAAITTFKKEKYYHVRLTLSGAEAASERISDKAEADALKTTCEASKAVCTSLVKEKKTAAPPNLFDKIGQAVRLAPGADLSGKVLSLADGFSAAFATPLPSLAPMDLLNRYQCHPPFLCPLQSYLERGTRTDPDLKNAC